MDAMSLDVGFAANTLISVTTQTWPMDRISGLKFAPESFLNQRNDRCHSKSHVDAGSLIESSLLFHVFIVPTAYVLELSHDAQEGGEMDLFLHVYSRYSKTLLNDVKWLQERVSCPASHWQCQPYDFIVITSLQCVIPPGS